jgi:hypothetical protein
MRRGFALFCAVLAAVVGITVSGGVSCNAYELTIESITFTRATPESCTNRWLAAIKNNGDSTVSGSLISVQAYQANAGGTWFPAGGTSIFGNINPGQTVTAGLSFQGKADSTQFKIVLFSQGSNLAEKVVPLPSEPPISVSIENCTISDTGYAVDVRNLNPTGISGITVQGYAASSANPNSWTPAGGMVVDCIQGGGIYHKTGPKPAGYDIIKVQVRSGNVQIAERIFNFASKVLSRDIPKVNLPPSPVDPRKIQPPSLKQ